MGSSVPPILDTVSDELGLPRPTGYGGGYDIQQRQLVALFHAIGDYLVGEHDWQVLVAKHSFNTVNATASYALPTYYASMVDDTMWDTTQKVKVDGPRSQPDWAEVEGWGVSVGPYYTYQIRGDLLYLQPTPSSVRTITYYYLASAWVMHS